MTSWSESESENLDTTSSNSSISASCNDDQQLRIVCLLIELREILSHYITRSIFSLHRAKLLISSKLESLLDLKQRFLSEVDRRIELRYCDSSILIHQVSWLASRARSLRWLKSFESLLSVVIFDSLVFLSFRNSCVRKTINTTIDWISLINQA